MCWYSEHRTNMINTGELNLSGEGIAVRKERKKAERAGKTGQLLTEKYMVKYREEHFTG